MKVHMIDCIVKLVSGEEVFSGIANVEGEIITLNEPMKISKRYSETSNGMAVQLNFEPFLDYSGSLNHPIHRQHIISCEPLIPRLCILYGEMKTSVKNNLSIDKESSIPPNVTIH